MLNSLISINIDLLSVGISVAAIGVLGFVVYFNNSKSVTNKSFLFLAVLTILWGISNYLEYKFTTVTSTLWALRFHLFISTWHALAFFQLANVFPADKIELKRWYTSFLVPIVLLTSILTLTPFVFSKIVYLAPPGQVTNPERGPGIIIFGIVAFGLLIAGIISLIRKVLTLKNLQRRQAIFILLGMFFMACLIILFNIILPVTFNNLKYIPFAALFILPFIILTSYTIYRHKLFNIKVATTATLVFILSLAVFLETIFSTDISLIIFRSGLFLLVLSIGILLIKSVMREVEIREKIEKLATDLKKSNDNLAYANNRLKELDQLKSEFVSLATHQIRAPLTTVKGYVSMIQEGDYGQISDEVRKALDIVFQSTNNLVTIVGDFLDVSRIEQGRMKYDLKNFDLKEIVDEVVTEYKPNVEKKGLSMQYHAEDGKKYMVYADPGKIKQIVGNVIDNSIKYTPAGNISLDLSQKDENFLIKVADTGVGIPPQTIPKLFQKFTRAENANDTNILGTGLGLYVAKQMVEALHGRIWAESAGEGKGSQFYIELTALK